MAGFFKNLKEKLKNFIFEEVTVDEQGNEKVIDDNLEVISSPRIDVVGSRDVDIEQVSSVKNEKFETKVDVKPKTILKDIENQDILKTIEAKKDEKQPKKTSMFVDFSSAKNEADDKAIEEKSEKIKSTYVPQRVISPIFGSDKDDYAVSINNLEYDSEKPKRSVMGTVFSPIFGRERIIEDVVDEVDENIAKMKTSDFLSDEVQSEENIDETIILEEKIEAPKPLYTKMKVAEQPITYVSKSPETKNETKTIENVSLFDQERVNKTLTEAKVAMEEIEKAAKPIENTSSYENMSLFD